VQGALNDFVLVDETDGERVPEGEKPAFARWACDRRAGVGADGVIFVRVRSSEVEMRIFNRDGSEAEFCGNAARCAARYATDVRGENVKALRTLSGRHAVEVLDDRVRVEVPGARVRGATELGFEVDAGVPHLVRLTERDPVREARRLTREAREIQRRYAERGGVNVTFAAPAGDALRVRTYERGVGWTPACGSGVVAAALVYADLFGADGPVRVSTAGGSLKVLLDDGPLLEGPAEIVYEGRVKGAPWREDPDHQR